VLSTRVTFCEQRKKYFVFPHPVVCRLTRDMYLYRLSTIRNMNTIAVIKEGRVVEQGSHRSLMAKTDGAYAQLIQCQQNKTGGNVYESASQS